MKYKGYEAVIRYSDEDETFVGEVVNTSDILVFDGETVDEVKQSFFAVVDEYLKDCALEGRKPNKPFSGKLMTRLNPATHRRAWISAKRAGVSLNKFIESAVEEKLSA